MKKPKRTSKRTSKLTSKNPGLLPRKPAVLTVHLFLTNEMPNRRMDIRELIECPRKYGYRPQVLKTTGWGTLTFEPAKFRFSQPKDEPWGRLAVYGYFVLRAGMLLYSERFAAAPYTMQVEGDEIRVTLSFGPDVNFGGDGIFHRVAANNILRDMLGL